ncbi:MAG: DUF3575 domain-containing protein [Bacteroidota bacterium]
MKKIIFIFLFVPLYSFSQEVETFKRNEIKLNVGYLLGAFPEVSYERLINDESGAGISAGININNNNSDNHFRFGIIPHYRMYFGKKPAAGFFMEGNLAFYSQHVTSYNYYTYGVTSYYEERNIFGFGAGIGIGGKFLSKKGVIAELLAGWGRNFVNTDHLDNNYPRFGISVGKRF